MQSRVSSGNSTGKSSLKPENSRPENKAKSQKETHDKDQVRNIKNLENLIIDPASIQDETLRALVKKLAEFEWRFIALLMDRLAMIILGVSLIIALIILFSAGDITKQVERHLQTIHLVDGPETEQLIQKSLDYFQNYEETKLYNITGGNVTYQHLIERPDYDDQ